MISEDSLLWQYMSFSMRDLVRNGEFLIADSQTHTDRAPTDYSYLVFPFAKLYEGFLKQLFLDIHIISRADYQSTHFRIGKALSPNLVHRLGSRSAYGQIMNRFSPELATQLWDTWRVGRNLVFHYFPHNYRALTRDQAVVLADMIVQTMTQAVGETHVKVRPKS